MIVLKTLNLTLFAASVGILTDSDEWKIFGALLVGVVLGGAGGLCITALSMKRQPLAVYVWRFFANLFCGLVLGAAALWYCITQRDMHTGPLFTVAAGGLSGLFGVGLVKIAEPWIRRRAQLAVGETTEPRTQLQDEDRYLPQRPIVAPSPPSVDLTKPK